MAVQIDQARTQWFRGFLGEIRQRIGEIGQAEVSTGPFIDFLFSPTQLAAIYVQGADETIVLAFHLAETQDGRCWAFPPRSPALLLDLLETIRTLPELEETIPAGNVNRPAPPASPTISALLAPQLLEIHTRVKEALGNPLGHSGFTRYWPTLLVGWFPTDIASLSVEESVTRMFGETRAEVDRMQRAFGRWPLPPPTREEIERAKRPRPAGSWLGTYLYPAVRVGPTREKPLSQRLPGVQSAMGIEADLVGRGVSGTHDWFVTHLGFLAIRESDRGSASSWMNAFGATLVLEGIPAFTVREHELCDVELAEQAGSPFFSQTGIPPSPRNYPSDVSPANPPRFARPTVLGIEQFRILHDRATVAAGSSAAWALSLLLDAYTYREYRHFGQSFISSWMIVEGFVDEEWESFLEERGVSGKRREALGNVHAWTAHTKTEALALGGRFSDEDYREISWARQRRNSLLHEVKSVTEPEAERGYQLAHNLCIRMIAGTTPRRIVPSADDV